MMHRGYIFLRRLTPRGERRERERSGSLLKCLTLFKFSDFTEQEWRVLVFFELIVQVRYFTDMSIFLKE